MQVSIGHGDGLCCSIMQVPLHRIPLPLKPQPIYEPESKLLSGGYIMNYIGVVEGKTRNLHDSTYDTQHEDPKQGQEVEQPSLRAQAPAQIAH